MRETAPTIIGIALGFIAAVASYPYLDDYMLKIFAFIVALAIGFVVYVLVERFVRRSVNNP